MCRYGYKTYKAHFACFKCRKAFKQPPIRDWLKLHRLEYAYDELSRVWSNKAKLRIRESELGITFDELLEKYRSTVHCCPQCTEPMIDMGLDFKPPREQDKKAWRILNGMFRVGHCFHTCGCNGPGWVPKSTSDYRRYLEDHRRRYLARIRNLSRANRRSNVEQHEARAYWAHLIEKIDKELRSLA